MSTTQTTDYIDESQRAFLIEYSYFGNASGLLSSEVSDKAADIADELEITIAMAWAFAADVRDGKRCRLCGYKFGTGVRNEIVEGFCDVCDEGE